MESLKACPICKSEYLMEYIKCKDHLLSGEIFKIDQCKNCGLLFTNPRPEKYEINKYYQTSEYISHSNTTKGIVNKIYHQVRKINHRKKERIIRRESLQNKLLDVGCGSGEFLDFMKKKGWNVCGVEPDEKTRIYATNHFKLNIYDEEQINNFYEKEFDIISMWHVLEHVFLPDERMMQLKKILKDDGTLLIAVPNSESADALFYKEFWAGYDVPRHLYHFNKESAYFLFKKTGFKCVQIYPMKFDAYYVSFLSEKYRASNQKLLKAFKTGRKSNLMAKKNNNNYSSLIFILKKEKNDF